MSDKRGRGRITAALFLAAVFLLAANVSEAKYSGGTRESDNPYRIATPNDVVLLFETSGVWNHFDVTGLLTFDNHNGKGCNILLNDVQIDL